MDTMSILPTDPTLYQAKILCAFLLFINMISTRLTYSYRKASDQLVYFFYKLPHIDQFTKYLLPPTNTATCTT